MARKVNKNKIITVVCVILAAVLLMSGCNNAFDEPSEDESSDDSMQVGGEPKKRVALTFDDGPHNVRTTDIVDELNKYGYHATFFVIGNRLDGTEYNGKEGLRYAVAAGNEVGIHGYTHETGVYYDKCSDERYEEELSKTEAAILKILPDYKVKLMRPVGGRISEERAKNCKYSVIMWDVDSSDWEYKYQKGDSDEVCREKVDAIVDNVMSSVRDGSIILMHDIYESTYDATVIILERLHKEGSEVVTVSELIGDDLKAGETYSRVQSADIGG